jgi:hypothetical protein
VRVFGSEVARARRRDVWRDDELARLGVSARSAGEMGHVPVLGPGRDARGACRPAGTAQGARPHHNTNPILLEDPPEREAVLRAGSKSPTMASRSSYDRERHATDG